MSTRCRSNGTKRSYDFCTENSDYKALHCAPCEQGHTRTRINHAMSFHDEDEEFVWTKNSSLLCFVVVAAQKSSKVINRRTQQHLVSLKRKKKRKVRKRELKFKTTHLKNGLIILDLKNSSNPLTFPVSSKVFQNPMTNVKSVKIKYFPITPPNSS